MVTYFTALALVQPDILQDGERLRVRLAADGQRDDVGARINAGTAATSAAESGAAAAERLRTQVPVHTIDPLILGSVERADRLSRCIGNGDLHITRRRRPQEVTNQRPALRVFADERLLAAGLLSALTVGQIRDRGTDVEQHNVLSA